jgi:hypothetical protein
LVPKNNKYLLTQLQLTITYRLAATNDRSVARLAATTGKTTLRQLASRTDRMSTTLGSTFTTTVRVIVRVHRGTAYVWSPTLPTIPTSLADPNRIMVGVTHLANRRSTLARHPSHFTTRQLQLCPSTLPSH